MSDNETKKLVQVLLTYLIQELRDKKVIGGLTEQPLGNGADSKIERMKDEGFFARVKSIICGCICNIVAESGARITDERLNTKGNEYADKIMELIDEW